MEIKDLSLEEFEKELSEGRATPWKDIIEEVKRTGKPKKIENLTRNQIASGYKIAKAEGLRAKGKYKEGALLIGPAD